MNMTKLAIVISAGLLSLNLSHASAIDTDEATVTLNIGKYAQITNLDDSDKEFLLSKVELIKEHMKQQNSNIIR